MSAVFLDVVHHHPLKELCFLLPPRLDSGGGDSRAEPLGRTSSYTRRETRLAALNKHEDDTSSRDYKKVL